MQKLIYAIAFSSALSLPGALFAGEAANPPDDVIARVGDQPITFSEINTMLNSSAVVGLSLPALGTPERDTVRIALLDKVVSANLVYLDALRQGVDRTPGYEREMQAFENAILAGLWSERQLAGEVSLSEDEIKAFFEESVVPGTELTDEARTQIEAALVKRKTDARKAALAERVRELRDAAGITIHEENLHTEGDTTRADDTPVATVYGETITWGEVAPKLIGAGKGAVKRDILAMEEEGRLRALNAEIDTRILAREARKTGLEHDPVFLRRAGEYRKTRLINLHRAELARGFEPSDEQLAAYFEANRAEITVPESRKVQMVVVESEEEVRSIKEKIEAGEMTMYEAARDHSIDPGAKRNLGEIGWILPGEGQPALDELAYALDPDELGGPVQTPAGWHLLKVMDVRDEQYGSLEDAATHKRVRRACIHEKLDEYVVDLRRNVFEVEVYEQKLVELAQAEADMVAVLAEQAQQPDSVTQKRLEELQKLNAR